MLRPNLSVSDFCNISYIDADKANETGAAKCFFIDNYFHQVPVQPLHMSMCSFALLVGSLQRMGNNNRSGSGTDSTAKKSTQRRKGSASNKGNTA